MHSTVLQLDIQGTPQAWIGLEATLRGGWNAVSGRQSLIAVAPIVAVRGHARRRGIRGCTEKCAAPGLS